MAKFNLPVLVLLLGAMIQLSLQVEYPPAEVTAFSSQRMNRFHHNFFHQTRMLWHNISMEEQTAIRNLGWAPPRPVVAYKKDGTQVNIIGDGGEDFLYMHRRMIAKVNAVAASAGSSWQVVGWTDCPPPGDQDWPVPPQYEITGDFWYTDFVNGMKTDAFYYNTILPTENQLKDNDYLRTLTLGELGLKLELDIHTWFHVRFSEYNQNGYRVQSIHPTEFVDAKWDVPSYDWLSDFYSAHINKHFWKIHGWIENKIGAWQLANGITTITWVGTWETGPMNVMDDLFQVAAEFSAPQVVEQGHAATATILGCVLGGLALFCVFAVIMAYILRKDTPIKMPKSVEYGTVAPTHA